MGRQAEGIAARLAQGRTTAWMERLRKAVEDGAPRVFTAWVANNAGPPLSVVVTKAGETLVQPCQVAGALVQA